MIQEEAIVLRSTQYKDSERIVTLLTKESGILSVLAKRVSQKDLKVHSLTTPLHRGDYILTKGSSDLYKFKDGHILDTFVELRRSFLHLKTALELLDFVQKSQMPGEAAPLLYLLVSGYLNALKTTQNPSALKVSFILKLLKHEGIYQTGELPSHIDALAHISHYSELENHLLTETELEEAGQIFKQKFHQMGAG